MNAHKKKRQNHLSDTLMTADSDINIVHLIKEQPEEGFRKLLEKYMRPIYWHIRRMVVSHEDAQDTTQETFVRIYRSIGQFRGESSLSTWIYRIATNEALRLIGKQHDIVSLDDADDNLFDMKSDDYIDYHDIEAVKMQKAIQSLPTKQKLVFNLRYYDELKYEQIAEITDSCVATVKVNYHIAKKKIMEFMNA